MKNTRFRQQGAWGQGRFPLPNLQALCACEGRIQHFQNLRARRDGTRLQDRDLALRAAMDTAVRLARTCAAEGDFRQARPGDLAAIVSNFAKLRRFPAVQAIDSILILVKDEVVLRAAEGSLSRWEPKWLALIISGLSKGKGAWVQEGLACLGQALLQCRRLTPEAGWSARDLAMVINGMTKAEGPHARGVLEHLAQGLARGRPLTVQQGWTSQPLAMVINGLARDGDPGPCVREALSCLAQALLGERQLTTGQGWSAQHLAMVINGLGKSEGRAVSLALERCAQAILAQDPARLSAWSAQDLAMIINGLGKGEGAMFDAALTHLAQCLPEAALMTPEADWSGLNLALVANGLAKCEGPAARSALTQLA